MLGALILIPIAYWISKLSQESTVYYMKKLKSNQELTRKKAVNLSVGKGVIFTD